MVFNLKKIYISFNIFAVLLSSYVCFLLWAFHGYLTFYRTCSWSINMRNIYFFCRILQMPYRVYWYFHCLFWNRMYWIYAKRGTNNLVIVITFRIVWKILNVSLFLSMSTFCWIFTKFMKCYIFFIILITKTFYGLRKF